MKQQSNQTLTTRARTLIYYMYAHQHCQHCGEAIGPYLTSDKWFHLSTALETMQEPYSHIAEPDPKFRIAERPKEAIEK